MTLGFWGLRASELPSPGCLWEGQGSGSGSCSWTLRAAGEQVHRSRHLLPGGPAHVGTGCGRHSVGRCRPQWGPFLRPGRGWREVWPRAGVCVPGSAADGSWALALASAQWVRGSSLAVLF